MEVDHERCVQALARAIDERAGRAVLRQCHIGGHRPERQLPRAVGFRSPRAAEERCSQSVPSPGPPADADRSTVDRRKALQGMKHADDARQALRVGADERLGQRVWPVVNDRDSSGNPCFAS